MKRNDNNDTPANSITKVLLESALWNAISYAIFSICFHFKWSLFALPRMSVCCLW